MIYLKLNYFDLLSPDPIYIQNVGGILSPTLRQISSIGIQMYRNYLSFLLMDSKLFEMLISNEDLAGMLETVFNFFIKENVTYSPQSNCFLVSGDSTPTGFITKEIFPQICDLICQRNYIKSNRREDLSQIKNKKALDIMKKLQKGRKSAAKQSKEDKNMELGNILSAVANKSQSLNILNIWDLTVFQVWDCFARLSSNSIYEIQSMSVAAWGNKDNTFDASAWFKRMDIVD